MTQFLRPDSTIGGGVFNASTGTLYGCIDETSPSDADYIYSTDNASGTAILGLSDVTTPNTGTYTVRTRIAKTAAGVVDGTGGTVSLTIFINEGTTTIATSSTYNPTGSWTTQTWTPDLSAISDWTNVRAYFQAGGTTSRGVGISWFEIEVPDTGTTYNETISESTTAGESVAATVSVAASVTESTTVTESVAAAVTVSAGYSESFTAGDSYAAEIPFAFEISESVEFGGEFEGGVLWGPEVFEELAFSDSYSATVTEPNGWEIPGIPSGNWQTQGGGDGGWVEISTGQQDWTEQ